LNNVFTYTFQILKHGFGHPALDTQCEPGKQMFQTGALDSTVKSSPRIIQNAVAT